MPGVGSHSWGRCFLSSSFSSDTTVLSYTDTKYYKRLKKKNTHTNRHNETHVPDPADLFLCARILRHSVCQLSAVSSVALRQLLQGLDKSIPKRQVKYLKECKPQIYMQLAWYDVHIPCSYVHTVSWSLWPLPAGGTRPPPVSL